MIRRQPHNQVPAQRFRFVPTGVYTSASRVARHAGHEVEFARPVGHPMRGWVPFVVRCLCNCPVDLYPRDGELRNPDGSSLGVDDGELDSLRR
jgi:hypothetical protein